MIATVSIILMGIFTFLGLVHFYWSLGGSLGIDKAIPEIDGKPTMNPGAIITALVGLALLTFGAISYLLGFYDLESTSYGKYVIYLGWLLSCIFALRAIGDFKVVGFFKIVKTTGFAKYDTKYYSPLCLFLAIIFFILSYSQASQDNSKKSNEGAILFLNNLTFKHQMDNQNPLYHDVHTHLLEYPKEKPSLQ